MKRLDIKKKLVPRQARHRINIAKSILNFKVFKRFI